MSFSGQPILSNFRGVIQDDLTTGHVNAVEPRIIKCVYIYLNFFDPVTQMSPYFDTFWKRCFLKTSVSNGIIYTKYTQNPHIIEPPFNIATQSATYTVTACVSRWEPNVLNANNPCPAATQKHY